MYDIRFVFSGRNDHQNSKLVDGHQRRWLVCDPIHGNTVKPIRNHCFTDDFALSALVQNRSQLFDDFDDRIYLRKERGVGRRRGQLCAATERGSVSALSIRICFSSPNYLHVLFSSGCNGRLFRTQNKHHRLGRGRRSCVALQAGLASIRTTDQRCRLVPQLLS